MTVFFICPLIFFLGFFKGFLGFFADFFKIPGSLVLERCVLTGWLMDASVVTPKA